MRASRCRVTKALDLTDPSTRDKLGIQQEDLVSNEWGVTQDLGRAARRAGFDALIVPSAAGDHHNLVIFSDLLRDDEIAETEGVDPAPQEP
jgi:RES domain-containing protein